MTSVGPSVSAVVTNYSHVRFLTAWQTTPIPTSEQRYTDAQHSKEASS